MRPLPSDGSAPAESGQCGKCLRTASIQPELSPLRQLPSGAPQQAAVLHWALSRLVMRAGIIIHRHVADVRSKHALPPLSWAVAGQGGMAQGSCPHGLQALRGPSPRPRLIVSRLLQAPRQPSQLLRPCQPSLAHLSSTFVCVASTRRSVEDRAAARPAWSSGGKASFAAGRRSSCRPTQ